MTIERMTSLLELAGIDPKGTGDERLAWLEEHVEVLDFIPVQNGVNESIEEVL